MSSTVRTKYILIHGFEKCPTRYEVNEMHQMACNRSTMVIIFFSCNISS